MILLGIMPLLGFSQEIDLLLLNQKYEQAIELINQKVQTKPSAELYFKRSMAYRQLVNYPAAIENLNAALSVDPTNITYLTNRADLYQSIGSSQKAVADFRRALSLKPNDLLLQYELGKAYLWVNDYSKAYKEFEKLQAADSTNLMFNKYSALAAFKAGKYKTAMAWYEKYLLQNPNDLSAYMNLSTSYEKSRRLDKCLETLRIAHNRFPDNRAAHLTYANTAFVGKNYELAQKIYDTFLLKYDTTFPTLLNQGICMYHNKHTEVALEVLELCYSGNPNDVYVNFYLGVCHKRLKHQELAARYLDFAIYISIPEFHPEMYHHLAQVYGALREFEKSIAAYKKAYELDSRKVEVLFEIATTYEEYNFNKTLALNYYQNYLKEAGERAENANYALDRIKLLKEDLFFEE